MFVAFSLGFAFVFGTIALVLGGYFLMRSLAARHAVNDTKELAGSVIFRISALHGLILALVFAQQMSEFQRLEDEIIREASAVANIYFDIGRHGSQKAAIVQPALSRYVDVVLSEEWPSLGKGTGLTPGPWKEWEMVYQTLLDVGAETPRKESLRDHMLEDIRKIAELRDRRANHGFKSVSLMFWFAALSGIFLISLAYYCFTPTRYNVILIAIFATFTGIVMYFIFSFSNPFNQPGAVRPAPFEKLQASQMFK